MKKCIDILSDMLVLFWPMWATVRCIGNVVFGADLPDTSRVYWFLLGFIGIIEWYVVITVALMLIHLAFTLFWVVVVAFIIWMIIELSHRKS